VPYEVAGRTIDTGTSIGIAVAPKDGEDPDELLKKADHALYRCKGGARKLCFLRAGRRAQKAGRSPEVKAGINDKRYIKRRAAKG
jgi:predicted signal transduction protein with EAL and GGDEF domain